MNILVTGASGVIGLKLVEHFVCNTSAFIDATYFSNSSCLYELSRFYPGRIRPESYSHIIERAEPHQYDQIWHFATYGQPARFIDSWQEVIDLNSRHIILLSKLLKQDGIFHFASTSELYSSLKHATEDSIPASRPFGTRSIYTESKRLGESICSTLFPKERHLIYRICLAYSNRFRYDDRRVLYELVMKGLVDNSICLLDDGSAKRQYIYIDDALKMMVSLSKDINRLKYSEPIFNIANYDPITILELANKIAAIIGCPVHAGKLINPKGALDSVEVMPKRYLELYPEWQFTNIDYGLRAVVQYARTSFPMSTEQ
jgi:nucleoside-diphosphate-sugar epimerase